MASGADATRTERDLRLDVFRGAAMFIILLAHTERSSWTLWIPARFGFSDATEIFVFCSGMASAIAFGAVFAKRGWALGAARIAYRVWQVYWAHIAVFFVCATLMALLDRTGMGDGPYVDWWPVAGLFRDPSATLIGLFTLTYVPAIFDILPMYLVILAMVPAAMLAHRAGGVPAFLGFAVAVWLAAQLALWRHGLAGEETHALGAALARIGGLFPFLAPPADPWSDGTWFFNPFAWQLVFFTGFAFGMRWLPAPPVTPRLLLLAGAYVLLTIPFAWFRIYNGDYLPLGWELPDRLRAARETLDPLIGKTGLGALRFLHFLAIGYLAWAAVGPGGARLREGFRAGEGVRSRWLLAALGLGAILTAPYAYVETIKALSPALDGWIFRTYSRLGMIPDEWRIGGLQFLHLFFLLPLLWTAIGAAVRNWIARDAFLAVVRVVRKVGTQSLAVFLASIVVARFNSWWLDVVGRGTWTNLMVNATGFAAIIAVAYLVGWFRSQPWRGARAPAAKEAEAQPVAREHAPGYLGAR